MAKDPAFLFYSSDFLVGTMALTFEDRGKYITLLSYIHQNGRINEETIRLLVGSISVNLKNKFCIDIDGFWFNERLEEEVSKRARFIESRLINGSKGGRPKKIIEEVSKPLGYPTDNLPEDVNINKDIIKKKDKGVQGKKDFIPPTLEEFKNYFKENNFREDVAERAWRGYSSADWHNTQGKPVRNWKQTANNVWFVQENKIQSTQLKLQR